MSNCRPDIKVEHGIWGPKEWSLDDICNEPELFKGKIELDRCTV